VSTAGHRTDGTLDGVDFQLVAKVEGTRPYRKGWSRQASPQVVLTPEGDRQSRQLEAGFLQDDWSQGSHWELPLLRSPVDKSYFSAENIDAFTKPGWLIPVNAPNAANDTNLLFSQGQLILYNRQIYAIGSTTTTSNPSRDVYKWDRTTESWVRETTYHANLTGTAVWSAAADPDNDTVYLLTGSDIEYFDPITPGQGNIISHGKTISEGANLMIHDGRLLMYDGNKLWEIEDPLGTPAVSAAIANDGKGRDILSRLQVPGSGYITRQVVFNTAIATSEGIYYVKNVLNGGQVEAWVFRIDRDAGGTDISTPVAVLPPGTMALDIGWHIGSVVITATPDWQRFLTNDATNVGHARVVIYHITQGQQGVLGMPLGEDPDQTPFKILGSDGTILYLGSHKQVWAYDAVRGAIHPWLTDPSPAAGVYYDMTRTYRVGTDESAFLFYKHQRFLNPEDEYGTDPNTVASFGDPPAETYVFESNEFDFGLAEENKTLETVTMIGDYSMTTSQKWTLFISVDGGSWVEVAEMSAGAKTQNLFGLVTDGRRFRYKLVYETLSSDPHRFGMNRLLFKAESGEFVPVWSLIVDANELRNVNNVKQNPQEVFEAWETLMTTKQPVTYVDSYRSADRSDTSSHQVKVLDCEFFKQSPTEGEIHVSFAGVDLEQG